MFAPDVYSNATLGFLNNFMGDFISTYGLEERRQELEQLMNQRNCYRYTPGTTKYRATPDTDRYYLGIVSPIMADGDILGCVTILMDENGQGFDETDQKIAQTAAGFLGKQMES